MIDRINIVGSLLYLTVVCVSGMKLCVEKAEVKEKKVPYEI